MDYKERFETRDVINLNVPTYPKGAFKYKPQDANEETDWIGQYMSIDSDTGKPIQDLKVLNKLKINQLVEVPYSQELIKEMNGIDKAWKDLNKEEKWRVLGKLKGKELDKILTTINNIDEKEEKKKKE